MRLANPVRDRLRDGGTAVGIFVQIPAAELVELSALAGFDFVLLDGEHGRITPDNAYPLILAAEAHGTTAMVRVGERDRQVVLKYLDLGAAGIVVPQVTTPEQAQEAVAGMRYHPHGIRGFAGGRAFDYGLGAPAKDLVQPINDRVLASVQFEHIDAFARLDEILATPGLDVLFVGPNDLAQSMGFPGQPGHPEVQALIDRVLAAMRGGPVAAATVAADPAAANALLARGFRMLVASVTGIFAQGTRAFVTGVDTAPNNT